MTQRNPERTHQLFVKSLHPVHKVGILSIVPMLIKELIKVLVKHQLHIKLLQHAAYRGQRNIGSLCGLILLIVETQLILQQLDLLYSRISLVPRIC